MQLRSDDVERVDRHLPLNRLDQHRSSESTYLVAWEDTLPVGHAHIAWSETHLGLPELQDVYVSPAHRRRGVATSLTHAAEDEARTRGWTQLSLSVSRDGNPDARRLYEQLGYADAGVEPVRVSGVIMLRGVPFEVDDTLVYLTKRVTTQIVFETHSTSEDNERGIGTGWLGGTLSATGREQAMRLAARRRRDGIERVYASDLNRAVQTAELAFAGSGIPVVLDWRLRECDYGTMNGMPRVQLDEQRPRRVDVPFPGGESWREAVARVGTFLDELATSHDRRVLLIGHVATRWALDHYLLDVPLEELVHAEFAWREGWEYTLPTP